MSQNELSKGHRRLSAQQSSNRSANIARTHSRCQEKCLPTNAHRNGTNTPPPFFFQHTQCSGGLSGSFPHLQHSAAIEIARPPPTSTMMMMSSARTSVVRRLSPSLRNCAAEGKRGERRHGQNQPTQIGQQVSNAISFHEQDAEQAIILLFDRRRTTLTGGQVDAQ